MNEEKIYDAIDPQIKKKYNKRFVRSICAIDDLLEKKRYLYDTNETGKNGEMEQLINLLNNLHEENQQLKEKIDLHILLTDNERQKTRNYIKKLETEKQEKEPNILQDIKEDLIREEYNKRMENKKYFKKNNHIQSIDIYGLITDAIYTRLNLFFEKGEWHDYMLKQITKNIIQEKEE